MKIAVLGWGSLIWDQRDLILADNIWHENGPELPIEFARVSQGGRLTLVIKPSWEEVKVMYATSKFQDLESAIENLKSREGTKIERIGFYNFVSAEKNLRSANESIISNLISWNTRPGFDAVIWTDLPPNFKEKQKLPYNLENISGFLSGLSDEEFASAEEYIFKTPPQIYTKFRKKIVSILGQIKEERTR
ncbi:hypothetical protein DBR40_02900 [Pedobacter sp. KBW01]|uniref:hypothetical protein n=1 Tax=Pedobacter sp. KBW01 TaxID=2153364 RepID=UPI000F59220B|nr:hypothetical protein [Pedobacter sp. KBW01]RQO79327.1 hypothetical protein DBR40_02900 [Pedobacter sp. KBW01]